jgi:zinc transport system ATP-binding protein
MTDATLLRAEGVSVRLGGRTVLDHVDARIDTGEIVTLIGPNGSGKTTLVRVLLGLVRPSKGRRRRGRRVRVGYVPQRIHVEPTLPLTVAGFLALGTRTERAAYVAALEEVGMAHLIDTPVQRVSGGELQRVLLARALLRRPDVLVLDEPAQGVDVGGQRELYCLIRRLRDRRGCAVLLVSHDLHLVMAATDRVLCLNGHVCCRGKPDAVSVDPEYQRLFGPAETEFAVYTHHHDHAHDVHGDVVPKADAAESSE